MLHTWYYTDWLYRPRNPEELDTALGGGVTFRQGAHQVDLLRWIGGGLVRSVRAATGAWDPSRPTEGSHVMFLTFQNGAAATAVYSGYDHFHTTELTYGVDERGRAVDHTAHGRARAALRAAGSEGETALKRGLGYGSGGGLGSSAPYSSFYGLTLVTCERGDIRQTRRGPRVYGDERRWDVRLSPRRTGRDVLVAEAYDAVRGARPPAHDGRWGRANLEACLAALQSAREDREIRLAHQVATPD
jgi:phthalate 4,5-cis-dihydrodiol dehydrogenase